MVPATILWSCMLPFKAGEGAGRDCPFVEDMAYCYSHIAAGQRKGWDRRRQEVHDTRDKHDKALCTHTVRQAPKWLVKTKRCGGSAARQVRLARVRVLKGRAAAHAQAHQSRTVWEVCARWRLPVDLAGHVWLSRRLPAVGLVTSGKRGQP